MKILVTGAGCVLEQAVVDVYGTEGTLTLPDPNGFDGPVHLFTSARGDWVEVPERAGYRDAGRGYGVADLARALRIGRACHTARAASWRITSSTSWNAS